MTVIMDVEQWLEQNALTCQRYHLRMSKTACQEHQQKDPGGCRGCEGLAPPPAKVVQWGSEERAKQAEHVEQLSEQPRRRTTDMKRIRACADCGQERSITARGLCSTCYKKARDAEGQEEAKDQQPEVGHNSEPIPPYGPQEHELATAILELLFPNGIAPRHLMQGLEVAADIRKLIDRTWGMR